MPKPARERGYDIKNPQSTSYAKAINMDLKDQKAFNIVFMIPQMIPIQQYSEMKKIKITPNCVTQR